MKTKTLLTVILAALLTVSMAMAAEEATPGQGPRGPRGEGMGMGGMGGRGMMMGEGNMAQMLLGRMGEQLNLTEQQRQSIQKIADDSRTAMQENRDAVRTAMQNLNDAADKGDETAVNTAGKAAGDALTKQAIQRAQVAKQINGVLTEEQRKQLEDMRTNMREQMQQRRQQMMQEGGRRGPRSSGTSGEGA